MDDWKLLQDFRAQNCEPAFATLVNRYIGLVYSSALRQVNEPQVAEEVTQSVFILLARKAGSFRSNIILAGWLFRTTHFVASRALRSETRRRIREQEAFQMQELSSPGETWRAIAPVLDEALDDIPAGTYRLAAVFWNKAVITNVTISDEPTIDLGEFLVR